MQWGVWLICLAAISWGTTGTTMVLLHQVMPMHPLVVGFWRMAIASPLLLLLASRTPGYWPQPRSTLKTYLGLGLCMAVYQIGYFGAVSLAGVAITALVAICSSPLLIALLAAWRLGETPTRNVYVALGLGLLGTGLLVASPEAIAIRPRGFLWGVVLALLAGFSYATYAVLSKATLAKLQPVQVAAFSFTAATLLLMPALWLQPFTFAALPGLPFLLYLGIVPTALAYALYMLGLRRTSATVAGILVLLEPFTATLLGVFLLREPMGLLGLLGALLLLGAIALLTIQPRRVSTGNDR